MGNKPTKARFCKQVYSGPPDRATVVYTYDIIREIDTASWVTTKRSINLKSRLWVSRHVPLVYSVHEAAMANSSPCFSDMKTHNSATLPKESTQSPLRYGSLKMIAPRTVTCEQCQRRFFNQAGLQLHNIKKHPSCPVCHEAFFPTDEKTALQLRASHQKTTGHCYCPEHDRGFPTEQSYREHLCREHSRLFSAAQEQETMEDFDMQGSGGCVY
jgi:hypothetical protein